MERVTSCLGGGNDDEHSTLADGTRQQSRIRARECQYSRNFWMFGAVETPLVSSRQKEDAVLPWSVEYQGRFDEINFESEVLKGNRLGDPFHRPLMVYVPPGYAT